MEIFSIQHRKGYNGRLRKVKRRLISAHTVVTGSKEHSLEMDMGSETKLSLTCLLFGHFGLTDVFHWWGVATQGLSDSDTARRKTNKTCDRHSTNTGDTPVSYRSSLSKRARQLRGHGLLNDTFVIFQLSLLNFLDNIRYT